MRWRTQCQTESMHSSAWVSGQAFAWVPGSQEPSATIPILVKGPPSRDSPRQHPKPYPMRQIPRHQPVPHARNILIKLPRRARITIVSSFTKYLYVSRKNTKQRLLRRRKWKNRNVVREKRTPEEQTKKRPQSDSTSTTTKKRGAM